MKQKDLIRILTDNSWWLMRNGANINFDAYRRANDNKIVRKSLTIPSWLNDLAEKAGVNFSQILQESLKEHLGVEKH